MGSALALQCHVEMTPAMVSEWAELGRDELQSPSPSVQSPQAMTAELAVHVAALHRVADVIYRRWLVLVLGFLVLGCFLCVCVVGVRFSVSVLFCGVLMLMKACGSSKVSATVHRSAHHCVALAPPASI